MNLVVPFGFYGCGNIGDEATLQGFARLLGRSGMPVRAWVGSRNPRHTALAEPSFSYFNCERRDPRRWLAMVRATAHVFVGGTPIMDVLGDWPLREVVPLIRSARRRRCPIVFIGIGTEELRQERSREIVATEIAPYVKCWTVRSSRDRDRLVAYGVSPETITTAADQAWLIEPASPQYGLEQFEKWGLDQSLPIVAVNLVNENSLLEKRPEIALEIAKALDLMIERQQHRVLFLCNEVREGPTFDRAAASLVLSRMKHRRDVFMPPSDYLFPKQMMSIIACCDLAISMRYHFCLFAAIQEVPFVALTRCDKVRDLCWDLEWESSIEPKGLSAHELLACADRAGRDSSLSEHVSLVRRRAELNIEAVDALVRPPRREGEVECLVR
jgi:polysaccharide pyruvyl transferase WcaK-like protein